MSTKENILSEALHLFAQNGYEAVSMRDIAGKVGITQGALYRHYAGKRDIFDSILRRMEEVSLQRSRQYRMPEGGFAQMAEDYRDMPMEQLKAYSLAQFRYWTQDPFASDFRKMLTLEQYRDPEMAALHRQYSVGGPIDHMERLFRELAPLKGWQAIPPRQMALEFFGPIYLLTQLCDGTENRAEMEALVLDHVERFTRHMEGRT